MDKVSAEKQNPELEARDFAMMEGLVPPTIAKPQDSEKTNLFFKEDAMGQQGGFIKLSREALELVSQDPNAFLLLTQIALRAYRKDPKYSKYNLGPNQCFIEGCSDVNLTDRMYRTAKERLTRDELATFRKTNRGTIATLCNTVIYDINPDSERRAERRARDEQETSSLYARKKEEEEINPPIIPPKGDSAQAPKKKAVAKKKMPAEKRERYPGIELTDKQHAALEEKFGADLPRVFKQYDLWRDAKGLQGTSFKTLNKWHLESDEAELCLTKKTVSLTKTFRSLAARLPAGYNASDAFKRIKIISSGGYEVLNVDIDDLDAMEAFVIKAEAAAALISNSNSPSLRQKDGGNTDIATPYKNST